MHNRNFPFSWTKDDEVDQIPGENVFVSWKGWASSTSSGLKFPLKGCLLGIECVERTFFLTNALYNTSLFDIHEQMAELVRCENWATT